MPKFSCRDLRTWYIFPWSFITSASHPQLFFKRGGGHEVNMETSGSFLIVEVRSIAHLTFPSRFIKCSSSCLELQHDGSSRAHKEHGEGPRWVLTRRQFVYLNDRSTQWLSGGTFLKNTFFRRQLSKSGNVNKLHMYVEKNTVISAVFPKLNLKIPPR